MHEDILQRLKSKLDSVQGLNLLIIFGSLAEGVLRKGSDVDVIVDCDDDNTLKRLYYLLSQEFGKREVHMIKAKWLSTEALLRFARRGKILIDKGFLGPALDKVPSEYFDLSEESKSMIIPWLKGNSVDMRVILSILSQISEDVKMLSNLSEKLDDVLRETIKRKALERCLHTSIEGMFDVLRHIVSRKAPGSFETYRELIDVAERMGIISAKTSAILRDLMIARHLLVHRYRGITDDFIKENMDKVELIWPSLKEEIRLWLQKVS